MYFFFSSRRRHTRSLCDWSSDVCSSDLGLTNWPTRGKTFIHWTTASRRMRPGDIYLAQFPFGDAPGMKLRPVLLLTGARSEERRVGKECRSRCWTYQYKREEQRQAGRME